MSKILTPDQIEESYNLGLQAYENEKSVRGAIDELANHSSLNRRVNVNTGGTLIRGFKKMMEGKTIENTISGNTLRVYLQNIYDDSNYGKEQVEICLNAVENFFNEHTHYKDKSRCKVHDDFSKIIGKTLIYNIEANGDQTESLGSQSKVTEKQIAKGYDLAKQVYAGKISRKNAVRALEDDEEMSNFSAVHLIDSFQAFIKGEVHKPSLSMKHTQYYLENVFEDYGKEALENFLNGLAIHIAHKEEAGHSCQSIRILHNEFSEKIKILPIYESTPPYDQINSNFRNSIEEKEFEETYKLARKVYEGKISHEDAVSELVKSHKMKSYSAIRSIDSFSHMMKGEKYKMGISERHLRYYLENVLSDYGVETLKVFLQGLEKHIEGNKRPLPTKRKIHNEFSERIGLSSIYESTPPYKRVNSHVIFPDDNVETYSLDDIKKDCFIKDKRIEEIFECFKEKKNLILQGPPGTGKTWLAKKLGYALIGKKVNKQVMSVQFHPNMSYEDFILGYRPSSEEGQNLKLEPGTFLKFAEEARQAEERGSKEKYVIVIEEINRGNPVQVFGEMLTLLEIDKRNKSEALRLSYTDGSEERDKPFHLPENIYVIGTMNLADKSLGTLDFAFRRRFAFIDLEPQFDKTWADYVEEHFTSDKKGFTRNIKTRIENLNNKIREDESLGKHFCIGHSYFTPKRKNKEVKEDEIINDPEAWIDSIFKTEIRPLLEEYWYDNPDNIDNADGSE